MLALGSSRTRPIHWHTLVPALLIPDSHVLDLGANVGRFSWEIACGFDCICHAVEPDPELLAHVPSHSRIKKYAYAIAARQAPTVLHRGTNRLGASIVGSSDRGSDDSRVRVDGIDLGTFIEQHVSGPISLIKMDIEGAEVEVLDSLTDELLVSIPQLSVEFHDFCGITPVDTVSRIVTRLQTLDFFYLRMSGVGHQDTLFVNRRQAAFGQSDEIITRLLVRNVRGIRRIVRRRLGLPPRC
ncbi:MAG: FkbM family methyltransferase [Isosphaeraceae bacterium]